MGLLMFVLLFTAPLDVAHSRLILKAKKKIMSVGLWLQKCNMKEKVV